MHSTHDSPPPCFKKCCTVYVKASLSRNPASFSNTGTKAYAPFFGLQWHNSLSVAGWGGWGGWGGGHFVHSVFVYSFIHDFYNVHCLGKLRHKHFQWHRAPKSLHKRSTAWACRTDSMPGLQGWNQYMNLFIRQFLSVTTVCRQYTRVLTGGDIKVNEEISIKRLHFKWCMYGRKRKLMNEHRLLHV